MKEKIKLIPALLALTAALIVSIITMLNKYSALDSMLIILAAILVFYMIGLIVRHILAKNFIIEESTTGEEDGKETDADNENREGEVTEDTPIV